MTDHQTAHDPRQHDAIKATPIGSDAVVAVPGRHERAALIDACPCGDCLEPAEPVAVVTDDRHRVAAYRCSSCGSTWLCGWATRLTGEPVRWSHESERAGYDKLADTGPETIERAVRDAAADWLDRNALVVTDALDRALRVAAESALLDR